MIVDVGSRLKQILTSFVTETASAVSLISSSEWLVRCNIFIHIVYFKTLAFVCNLFCNTL